MKVLAERVEQTFNCKEPGPKQEVEGRPISSEYLKYLTNVHASKKVFCIYIALINRAI